jgi:hypothetical protein
MPKALWSSRRRETFPLLRQVRNSRFISHSQLFEILQHDSYGSCRSTFNWRVHRLLKARHI